MSGNNALGVSKTTGTVYKPVFLDILEDIHGGVALQVNDLKTTTLELLEGTMIGESADTTGVYHVLKTATVLSATSLTTIILTGDNEFVAGDFMCNGTKSTAIVSITANNTVVLTAALDVAASEVVYAGTSEGLAAADIVQEYTPVAMTRHTVAIVEYSYTGVETLTNISVGAVTRGAVDESILPYPIPSVSKTSLTDRIRFA